MPAKAVIPPKATQRRIHSLTFCPRHRVNAIMPAFLRENLPYKLLALAFAVLLHFYVVNQQTPGRLLTVPLTLRNLPTDVLVGLRRRRARSR